MDGAGKLQANNSPDSRPSRPQEAAGRPEAVQPSASPQNAHARPGPPEGAGEGNGAAVEVLPPFGPRPVGRPRGSLNKATKEIQAVAQKYTARACRKLWELANEGETQDIQLKATIEILDRGHGRPTQTQLVGGTEGGPLLVEFLRSLPE